jgi:hypothetical protein
MNKLILIALFSATLSACSAEINLLWDASETPGVTNYTLYAHTNAITQADYRTAVVRVNSGTNLATRLQGLAVGKWWFCATAVKDNVESDISNVLLVEAPKAPGQMRVLAIQYTHTLTNEWTDVGFFKLKIQ